jgi:hypothetical protein
MHKISEVGDWAIAHSGDSHDKVRIVSEKWGIDGVVPKRVLHDLIEALRQATESEPG